MKKGGRKETTMLFSERLKEIENFSNSFCQFRRFSENK